MVTDEMPRREYPNFEPLDSRETSWGEIRRRDNPYDHPEWHYVDHPLEPPTFPDKRSPFPTNDILYGISQSEKMIRDTNSSLEMQAAYFSWLIHLVGDIHQPLHCSTLVNTNYPAPAGDRGGNNFYIKPAKAAVNLHSLWDRALGGTANPKTQLNYAIQISTEQPRASLPELWLTAINERERVCGRRHREEIPVQNTLLPAEPVRTWASWIERTVKEDA
jgi:hypothetical protein